MTKNKHFRSVFAALLCVVLCMTAFATVAYADGGDYYDDELPPETWQEEPQPEDTTIVPGTPFTEDGIAATRDLLYDKHTNKQFTLPSCFSATMSLTERLCPTKSPGRSSLKM